MPHQASRHIAPAKKIGAKTKDLAFIIPCASAGARMKSYGPKALISIGGQSLIERQISIIRDTFPNSEIIVVVGFEASKMRKKLEALDDIRMVLNPIHEETGVAFSIALGLYVTLANTVVISYGDLVYNKIMLNSLIGYQDSAVLIVDSKANNEVGVLYQNNIVLRLAYSVENKWSQIAVFRNRELRLLKSICFNPDNYKRLGSEVLNQIIEKKGVLNVIIPEHGFSYDIDSPKDIQSIRQAVIDSKISLTL